MRKNLAYVMAASLLAAGGCGGGGDNCPTDPLKVTVGGCTTNLAPNLDTDHDGVPDVVEGSSDPNGNGVPALLDGTEKVYANSAGDAGSYDSGSTNTEAGTGFDSGSGLTLGTACTATDTCQGFGTFLPGCCSTAGTCGVMPPQSSSCFSAKMCGSSPCYNANPCCDTSGACGQYAADGVTCGPAPDGGVFSFGDGGFNLGDGGISLGDGGISVGDSSIPFPDGGIDCSALDKFIQMAGFPVTSCCASDGTCGINFGGCLSPAFAASVGFAGLPMIPCSASGGDAGTP